MTFYDFLRPIIEVFSVLILYSIYRTLNGHLTDIEEKLDNIREISISTRDYTREIGNLLKRSPERGQGK